MSAGEALPIARISLRFLSVLVRVLPSRLLTGTTPLFSRLIGFDDCGLINGSAPLAPDPCSTFSLASRPRSLGPECMAFCLLSFQLNSEGYLRVQC